MGDLIKRRLGRTNLQVTALGMGCFQNTGEFGVPRDEGERVLDFAFNAGINYFDTAQMYGFGESEELLGRALRRHGRDKAYISTKCGWLDRTIIRNLGDGAYKDEAGLRRAIKHSFWLLQTDYVDVFMVHEPNMDAWWGMDPKTGDCVLTTVLEDLKKQGVIGAVGLGCWMGDRLVELVDTGRFDVVLVAGGMSLVHLTMHEKLVPAAKKHDVGVILGGAFRQGISAQLLAKQPDSLNQMLKTGEYPMGMDEATARKILALYDIADEFGVTMPELTIRFVLAHDAVHTHIAGARCVDHISGNYRAALKGPLPQAAVDKIRKLNGC